MSAVTNNFSSESGKTIDQIRKGIEELVESGDYKSTVLKLDKINIAE